ncbi:2-hydroxyisoflavanone dehydratase [Prunus yedoensis var. nudiflora]|uniref:2-hydroxyisoflavanone dehydratase n=1 Tax=Prunus yedoensis var. nudiflora TaxID=2094558 RepID=A0A314ZWJ6_PRUYE|nr:2-hydroxyisoflavanone dehydratase [Prunus yedoensis var. nudiflora]
MASTTKELAFKAGVPFIRIYKDGKVERLRGSPHVPPSPDKDPETGVSSKDITISHNPNISARLYLPNLPQNQIQKLPILFTSMVEYFALNLPSHSKPIVISTGWSQKPKLAPENPLPVAYEDSWAALQWVASHSNKQELHGKKDPWLAKYGDFDRLYIGGDSAGGNIAHNLAIKAGLESLYGGVRILGVFLSHSYFWGSKPIGSEPKGEDFEKTLEYKAWDFVYPSAPGGHDNPMLNPVGEGAPSLAGLGCSKLLVCVAGQDQLRDRGVWYFNLVRESGWKGEVELFEVKEEEHCYHLRSETEQRMLRNCSNAWLLFL